MGAPRTETTIHDEETPTGVDEMMMGKNLSDDQLTSLLASLYQEPVKEAHFEERFIANFHERVAANAVCGTARHLVWEHLVQMFRNFGMGRIALASSSLMALAIVGVSVLDGEASPESRSSERLSAHIAEADAFRLRAKVGHDNDLDIDIASAAPKTQRVSYSGRDIILNPSRLNFSNRIPVIVGQPMNYTMQMVK